MAGETARAALNKVVEALDVQPVIDALTDVGCRPKKSPLITLVGRHSFVHLLYTPPGEFYDVQFDLLLATTSLEKSALKRSVVRSVAGVNRPIHVLNCDDLILFKLVSGRLIDLTDAAMLFRENRDSIDFIYLRKSIGALQLSAEFSSVWVEAFPGELVPSDIPA